MYERQLSASRGIELVPLLLAIFLSCAIPASAAEDPPSITATLRER